MPVDYREKRKAARLDIPIRVEYSSHALKGSSRAAHTKNISAGGCLLVTSEELPIDSVVELDIYVGEHGVEPIKLTGSIVREAKCGGQFEYGISFAQMNLDAKKKFADFCFSKMYELIGLSKWPTARNK